MTSRLAVLFLRSRQGPLAVAILLVIGVGIWFGFAQTDRASVTRYIAVFSPVAAATVVAMSAQGPFGEAERTASRALAPLRAGHLGGLLLWSGLLLALAVAPEPHAGMVGILLRDGAAYAGIGLLGARFIGPAFGWLPAGVVAAAACLGRLNRVPEGRWWMWPMRDSGDGVALLVAAGLLVVGLAVVVWSGPREPSAATA